MTIEIVKCPSCASHHVKFVDDYTNKMRCTSCALVFVPSVNDLESIQEIPNEILFDSTSINQQPKTKEALRRYNSGEKLNFSTGIHDGLTWGYGKLDKNGFFEYEVPFSMLRPEHQKIIRDIER